MATPLARTAKPGRTLTRLAEGRATGLLTVQGEPDGVVELRDGLVTAATVYGVETTPYPPARPGSLAAEVQATLQIVDSLFVLSWGRVRECRFGPAEIGGTPAAAVPVGRLLAEVDRRTAALSADGPPVDPLADRVGRCEPDGPAALTSPAEQELLAAADGTSTCAELAGGLGRGVYGTTLSATRLRHAGLLEVVAVPGVLASLNRRRPGASRARPRDPAPALFNRSDPEVVDRLMSALDSLRAARRFAEPIDPQ